MPDCPARHDGSRVPYRYAMLRSRSPDAASPQAPRHRETWASSQRPSVSTTHARLRFRPFPCGSCVGSIPTIRQALHHLLQLLDQISFCVVERALEIECARASSEAAVTCLLDDFKAIDECPIVARSEVVTDVIRQAAFVLPNVRTSSRSLTEAAFLSLDTVSHNVKFSGTPTAVDERLAPPNRGTSPRTFPPSIRPHRTRLRNAAIARATNATPGRTTQYPSRHVNTAPDR